MTKVQAASTEHNMRDEVKRITVELLLRYGYQGLRFRDIAETLGTTRANIHHHFGNKMNLCEEVILDYVEQTLSSWEKNWCSDKTLEAKIEGMMEANRARYLAFNPTAKTANPWSLIGRMRLERETIGPRARQALVDFGSTLDRLVLTGVSQAIETGELVKDAPINAIALQLVAVADSAGFITQDGGDFSRLEQLYRSISLIVHKAYGRNS
ncbi:TetR/AcrR family transcriptional regulator [Seohaeicola saemankumensis]|uniref:TetR/AcrR family transcriptional regulator n=1 Tax=Seohaeicola saemankumensis TaxID=481181 RepID=UPI0035D0F68B